MNPLKKLPLWLKLAFLTTACMLVLGGAMAYLAVDATRRAVLDSIDTRLSTALRAMANVMADKSVDVVVETDAEGAVRRLVVRKWPAFAADGTDHSVIDHLSQVTGMKGLSILVYDPRQRDFVRTTKAKIPGESRQIGVALGDAHPAARPIAQGETFRGTVTVFGDTWSTVYLPIFSSDPATPTNAAGVAGILGYGISVDSIQQQIETLAWRLLAASAVLLTIATLLAGLVCYGLLLPLRTAARQIRALAAGEIVNVAVTRQDEFGKMQAALVELAEAAEAAFLQAQMIQQTSQAFLAASVEDDLHVRFVNEAALALFGELAQQDPSLPPQVPGARLTELHPRGHEFEQIVRDPSRLPHSDTVAIGEEVVVYRASALTNRDGSYFGPTVTITSATQQARTASQFETDVASLLRTVAAALDTLKERTRILEETARSGNVHSSEAASVAAEASEAVQTVASAIEELNGSFSEVAERISVNAAMARDAAAATEGATAAAKALEEAGQRISDVVTLISEVAGQTNLLALNATIEASRAGDAGKGFAVVASEVKHLAERAANATSEITAEVAHVKAAGHTLLGAVQEVQKAIRNVDEVSAAVAAAVNEQQVTTDEIARTVHNVAHSAGRVQTLSQDVNASSDRTGEAVGEVSRVTRELDNAGRELGERAQRFLAFVRRAA